MERGHTMVANLFDLTGKVALVTGGNSGLGLGFATGMAKCQSRSASEPATMLPNNGTTVSRAASAWLGGK